ncbi:DUF4129 domain-containing protein [Flavobacterium agrisoli]|uniref:DUF4129 domain-containing protein n=1 Tax=Flavobacterium agrisoli TaxID=2793066 RepID=A0A934UIT6_9FLAO|nr:DUF4129 domain-containing protein [Flavobacterium agrisoli]MBK0368763.1 DUF4129 domain-containing protein [Flavobacterium agrisoli]
MNKFLYFIFFLFASFVVKAQESLDTLKIQVDTATIAKKTFDKNFKSNYTERDFKYDPLTNEKNTWDRFVDWINQLLEKLFGVGNKASSSELTGIILKILAAAIVLFVIYRIVKAIINKEGQWIFGKDSHKKNIHYSDLEKNIHLVDFEKLIQTSRQNGQKRLIIRYYYLWLLKTMAQHYFIKWDIEKTNSDYLAELQLPKHKEEFAYLSYLYNYIWYGEFDINETTFQTAENRFKKALSTFSNE